MENPNEAKSTKRNATLLRLSPPVLYALGWLTSGQSDVLGKLSQGASAPQISQFVVLFTISVVAIYKASAVAESYIKSREK
jgi:hypothetical protein